jgi:histidine phosphotransferase ChpT
MGQGKHSKHRLVWRGMTGQMAKDKVKLLLNLVAAAVTALPRGGEIAVTVGGSLDKPSFALRCQGTSARPPQYLADYVGGGQVPQLDALSIQAYYTWRLAVASKMRLDIAKEGADVIISAKPAV